MLYDRHLAYDSNVQNFADTSRIWRSIFSSSSSYHTHRPHHQNDVHFTYCYYWNYIRYIILEAHLFLEMSWSITMNTHMNARHKKSETQSSLIGLEAMPKLLFLVRWWNYGLGKPRILFEHTTTTELIMTIYCICSCSPNPFCYSWLLL